MGPVGLEPTRVRLKGGCSTLLSYDPVTGIALGFVQTMLGLFPCPCDQVVGLAGLEPARKSHWFTISWGYRFPINPMKIVEENAKKPPEAFVPGAVESRVKSQSTA